MNERFQNYASGAKVLQVNSDFMKKEKKYWLYAMSQRKVESHCKDGLCGKQIGQIYKQGIIVVS